MKTKLKQELIRLINNEIKRAELKISSNKIQDGMLFTYWFKWHSEEMFKQEWRKENLTSLVPIIEGSEDDQDMVFKMNKYIESMEKFISRSYNVRTRSTSAIDSEVSTWEFIYTMDLIQELKVIMIQIENNK